MSENLENKSIKIKTVNLRPAKDLIESLDYVFKSTGAMVELETTQFEVKSFEPVHIEIVLKLFGELTLGYAIGRYALEPVFKWFEQLAKNWIESVKYRHPLQPLNISLKLEELDLIITTEPYLLSVDWIDNYCQNIAEILMLFSQGENLKGTTRIRLLSISLDDIKVLTYSDKRQPDYFIDLETKTVKKIFDHQQEVIYVFPETNGIGILGFLDDRDIQRWIKSQLLRAELQDQLLKKLGRK